MGNPLRILKVFFMAPAPVVQSLQLSPQKTQGFGAFGLIWRWERPHLWILSVPLRWCPGKLEDPDSIHPWLRHLSINCPAYGCTVEMKSELQNTAPALQRRGCPFPIKCCCNFTFNWEDPQKYSGIGESDPPLNPKFHWEDQQRY